MNEMNINSREFAVFCKDKLMTFRYFSSNGIDTPKTCLLTKKDIEKRFPQEMYVVVKPRFGQKGEDVRVMEKEKAALLDIEDYICQEKIESKKIAGHHFDVRVFVQLIDSEIFCIYSRTSRNFVTNIAQGGRAEDAGAVLQHAFGNDEIVREIMVISKKVVNMLKKDFSFHEAGLDFLIDETGKIFLLEINSMPGLSGIYILKDPQDSKYGDFEIRYTDASKKKHKRLLDEILKNRQKVMITCAA